MPDRRFDPLDELKPLLPIPEAWRRLGLPGEPAPRCRSPFRHDPGPSFTIFGDGLWWKDQSTGDAGEVIKFITLACGITRREAVQRFYALIGMSPGAPAPCRLAPPQRMPHRPSAGSTRGEIKAQNFRRGTDAEIEAVARIRRLRPEAVTLARNMGTLCFDTVCGCPCWLLTDADRRIAEARRMDGSVFPAIGQLGERKAHTLKGSCKSWPVGVAKLREAGSVRALMLVEGGPDYLAALHFLCTAQVRNVLPIAILGRSTGGRIDPEALALMSGLPVRIYPHADADGGGETAGQRWAAQLQAVGCKVSRFDFQSLARDDGRPVNDLNDLALCSAAAPGSVPATLLP